MFTYQLYLVQTLHFVEEAMMLLLCMFIAFLQYLSTTEATGVLF